MRQTLIGNRAVGKSVKFEGKVFDAVVEWFGGDATLFLQNALHTAAHCHWEWCDGLEHAPPTARPRRFQHHGGMVRGKVLNSADVCQYFRLARRFGHGLS